MDFDREPQTYGAARPSLGVIRELLEFLIVNRKWWIAPLVLTLLLLGILLILGETAAGPFIYSVF